MLLSLLFLLACDTSPGARDISARGADQALTEDSADTGSTIEDSPAPVAYEDKGQTYDDDGDGQVEAGGDCDDTDPSVYTGATEQCNGIDDDCDTVIDADMGDAMARTYYPDQDEDGCYAPESGGVIVCDDEVPPEGWLPYGFQVDCNDHNPDVCEC